ncbi:hypothetical protein PIROE2DRAFT_18517, partial [Piromyces sp. E2]
MKFRFFGVLAILTFDSLVLSSPYDGIEVTDSINGITAEEPTTEILYFKEENKDNVCNTQKCIDTSNFILDSINSEVNPCDDFYQFACGNWVAKNPVSEKKKVTSNFFISREENK